MQRPDRRPLKRPPWRSYVPFAIFCAVCLTLLLTLLTLLAHLVPSGGGHAAAPTSVVRATVSQRSPAPGTSAASTVPGHSSPSPDPTQQALISSMPNLTGTGVGQITRGGPLPTRTPRPTATPSGQSAALIARDVDGSGNPLKAAIRFVSPATRLYAVVTVRHVHSADMLRFVFEKDGVVLPQDVIYYTAGVDAGSAPFSAYADYANGTQPLPRGHYRLLFYRNGTLETIAPFEVG